MKVLCIGHASYDISMLVEDFPKENTKYRLKEKVECPGGPALTASLLLGMWDTEVYYTGLLGKDYYGNTLFNELKRRGVNTEYVIVKDNIETTKTFILINKKNASRTLFNVESPDENIKVDYKFTPDIILMDGEHYSVALDAVEKFPNAIKVVDAGKLTDEVVKLCKMSDYIICSKEFAELSSMVRVDYSKPDTLKEMLNKLHETYDATIVITQEEKGCLYKVDDKIKMMSGIKVNAKDTTGAGDIFHGAFVYGLSKKLPLEKCLKIANIAAGLSVKKIGASNSIPEVEEVYRVYEKNR